MKAKSKISFAFIICFLLSFKENVFTWAWMSALVCPSGRADAHVNVGQAIGKCSKSLELWASAWGAFMRPTISSWDTNRLSNLLFDLLLREKRLQAIKEKPSLASSSFCWPFLFLFPFGQQEDDSSQWWESRERSRSSFFFSSFSCKRTIRWKKKWWSNDLSVPGFVSSFGPHQFPFSFRSTSCSWSHNWSKRKGILGAQGMKP